MKIILLSILLMTLSIYANKSVDPDNEHIRYQGRVDWSDPQKPSYDWPWFSASFTFTGPLLAVKIKDGSNKYDVYIDGEPYLVEPDVEKKHDNLYVIAENLSEGAHHARLVKRTEEPAIGTFLGIEIADTASIIPALKNKSRLKIEFIGDSFLTGHGCESPDHGPDPNDPEFGHKYWLSLRKYTNVAQSVGPLVGDSLDADITVCAISGKGIIRNGNNLSQDSFIFDYYTQTYRTEVGSSDASWDFSQWTPDLVVIHLGINDFGGDTTQENSLPPADTIKWKEAYRAQLDSIRTRYDNVNIICMATSEWKYNLLPVTLKRVVDEEIRDGHTDVYFFQYQTSGDALGWHPSVAENRIIASKLVRFIREQHLEPVLLSKATESKSPLPIAYHKNSLLCHSMDINTLRITNPLGREVMRIENPSINRTIDISNLSPGVYFAISNINERHYSYPFVISK